MPISSKDILYSKGKNDERYTPAYAVEPLLRYIPPNVTIWMPFDREESQFVKVFRERGYKVIRSHIDDGQDFFTYEPDEHWDIMVSNPPFSNKKQIFERALSFNKPICLLMTLTWLNDKAPYHVFKDHKLQFIFFDKRTEFFEPDGGDRYKQAGKRITFNSAYYCNGWLKNDVNVGFL